MSSATTLDWLIFAAYLGSVLLVGMVLVPRSSSEEDYYLGGRGMNWLLVGISIFAGGFSALSFVGMPREAAFNDYHLYLALLMVPLIVTPVLWYVFIPLYHRLQVLSAYEYLEQRFDRRIRRTGSTLYALYTLGWSGTMLYAIGIIMELVLGLSTAGMGLAIVAMGALATAYTMSGGMRAVVWADCIQFVVIGIAVVVLLVAIAGLVPGGLAGVWEIGNAHGKFRMFDFELTLSRPTVYAAIAYGGLVMLAEFAVSQTSVQRYMTMPSVAAARRALIINATALTVLSFTFFLIGSALFAFYHSGVPTHANVESGFPTLARQDHLLSYFILTELPGRGFMGIFLAGLVAAALSSLDGAITSLSAIVASERAASRLAPELAFDRRMTLLWGLLIIFTALIVGHIDSHVFNIIMKIAGTVLGPLLGVFLLGILVPRANAASAAAGLAAGFLSLFAVMPTAVSHWWYGVVACVPTLVVGALAGRRVKPATTA